MKWGRGAIGPPNVQGWGESHIELNIGIPPPPSHFRSYNTASSGYTLCRFAVGEGDLRLDSSFSTNSFTGGRLEIFLHGEWGTVCDNGFGLSEGNTACRQLGYFSATTTGNVNNLG